MKKYLLLLLALGFAVPSFSQQLKGTVVDGKEGYALPGANIYWKSSPSVGTITDLDGKFELSLLPEQKVDSLIISFIGYQVVQLFPEVGNSFTVQLFPNERQMEEVVVKAQRLAAEEFTIHTLSQLDVYTNPMAKADPLLAVNALPAATTLDESANVSLRGSGPAETGIFLDQVPIYEAARFAQLNGIGTFSIFNIGLISQLNVFPSNPPLEFGNTSSGLIAMQTTDRVPEKASGNVMLSLVGAGFQLKTPMGQKNGLTFFGNYQPSAVLTSINAEALENLHSFNLTDAGMAWVHRSGKSVFKVFQYGWKEGYDFNYQHPSYTGSALSEKDRSITIGQWRKVGKRHEFTLNAGYSISKERFQFGNADVRFKNRDSYLSANLTTDWKGITFKHGLSWDHRFSRAQGESSQWRSVLHPDAPAYEFETATEVSVPEYYSYVRKQWKSGWTLGGGIRRFFPVNDVPRYLSWQAGLTREWNDHRITFSAGNYHKQHLSRETEAPATFFETRQYAIDHTLTAGKWQITTAVYHKQSSVSRLGTDTRLHETKTWGMELFVRFIEARKFQADLVFSSLHAEERQNDLHYPGRFDLDYFLKGTFRYQITPSFWCNGSWMYRQGAWFQPVTGSFPLDGTDFSIPVYDAPDQQKRLPHYGTMDLSLNKMMPLSRKLGLIAFMSVNNVTNRKNVRGYTYSADYAENSPELFSQRTFFIGGQLQF